MLCLNSLYFLQIIKEALNDSKRTVYLGFKGFSLDFDDPFKMFSIKCFVYKVIE